MIPLTLTLIVAGCMLAAVALAEIETAGPMGDDP